MSSSLITCVVERLLWKNLSQIFGNNWPAQELVEFPLQMLALAIALLERFSLSQVKFHLLVQGDPKIGLPAVETNISVAVALILLYLSGQKHCVNCSSYH